MALQRVTAICCLMALVGLGVAESASAQPSITNGSFETEVPANGTGGGWTTTNISGGWRDDVGNPAPSYYLNSYGQVDTDPTMVQIVDGFVIGMSYTLHGECMNDWGSGDGAGTFVVYVDGSPVYSGGQTGGDFVPFSVTFTATATTHEISIAAEVLGSDHSYLVDNLYFEGQVPLDTRSLSRVKAIYR